MVRGIQATSAVSFEEAHGLRDSRNPESGNYLPFAERLTCTVSQACAATGLGRTKLYELIAAGSLQSTMIGRRRLIDVRSLSRIFCRQDPFRSPE